MGSPLVLTFSEFTNCLLTSLAQPLLPTMPRHQWGGGPAYLMLAILQVHGAWLVGNLIGLVLLIRLQGNELGPLPVLTLKDGVQIPCLVGTV